MSHKTALPIAMTDPELVDEARRTVEDGQTVEQRYSVLAVQRSIEQSEFKDAEQVQHWDTNGDIVITVTKK